MSAREEDLVLVLNAGSSSLKFALFENAAPPVRTVAGAIDRIGSGQASFTLKGPKPEQAEVRATNHVSGLEYLLERLSKTIGTSTFRAVGDRVVHGGARYREPQREAGRRARRPAPGHEHGLYAGGRPANENTLGRPRSGSGQLSRAYRADDRGTIPRHGQLAVRIARRIRNKLGHARLARVRSQRPTRCGRGRTLLLSGEKMDRRFRCSTRRTRHACFHRRHR